MVKSQNHQAQATTMQIILNELPENIQKLFNSVEQSKVPLTVIHKGEPIVIIQPATKTKERPVPGFMKEHGKIIGDILEPLDEPWEVLQ